MRSGSGSPVDQEADRLVEILKRLGGVERIGHVHQFGGGFQSWRNKLGNGTARICQRPTSLAGIATDAGQKTVDRMGVRNNALGVVTLSQVADAPAGTGLVYSLKAQFTTADAAPAAGDYCFFSEAVEGIEAQDLLWGTVNAKPVTFGFFVKATITGTFVAALYRSETTPRHISKAFTVTTANVWQYVSITFPGDQTTAVTNDSLARISCEIWYGAGTNFNTGALQTAWGNSNNPGRAAGVTNLAATINNSIQITGWQFEAGNGPTPLEILRYDEDLRWCQRYAYVRTGQGQVFGEGQCFSAIAGMVNVPLPVAFRATPTLVVGAAAADFAVWTAVAAGQALNALPTFGAYLPGGMAVDIRWATAAGMVAGDTTHMYFATANGILTLTADI